MLLPGRWLFFWTMRAEEMMGWVVICVANRRAEPKGSAVRGEG